MFISKMSENVIKTKQKISRLKFNIIIIQTQLDDLIII